MQITQEDLALAAEREQSVGIQAENARLSDRVVMLRAYVDRLESLLDAEGIEFRTEEEVEPKKPQDRKKPAAKKTAAKKK